MYMQEVLEVFWSNTVGLNNNQPSGPHADIRGKFPHPQFDQPAPNWAPKHPIAGRNASQRKSTVEADKYTPLQALSSTLTS